MALGEPTSDLMSVEQYRLHATHNPTQTAPSFLLPIFIRPPYGNALYAQRVSLSAETILGFEVVSDALSSTSWHGDLTVRVNHPVIHAFEMPSHEVIVGTRSELKPRLSPLAVDRTLIDLPSLRLDVIEFCELDHLISQAAQEVYRFLQSVSSFSAVYWRDHTFLAERARRNLQRYIAGHEIEFDDWTQLGGMTLAIKNGRPVLTCSAKLHNSLKPDIDWDAWVEGVKQGLRFHIGAFGKPSQLQFVVGSDGLPGQEAPISPITIRTSDRWLVAAIGQTAAFAAKEIQRRGIPAVDIDTSRSLSAEDASVISAAQRTSGQASARAPILLVVISSVEESASAVGSFLDAVPADVRPYAIVLHRTQDGVPSDKTDSALFKLDRFEGMIVIPDNDFPIGEASTKTSRGTLLVSLIAALDRLLQDHNALPKGRSVYSIAWTRQGLRGYQGALARSIAAAANSWVSISHASRAEVSLSSVGRPDSDFAIDVTRELNAILFDEDAAATHEKDNLAVESRWIQRRFLPGGNIPATVELFLTGITDEPRSPEDALAETAKIILAAAGYEVRDDRNGDLFISTNGEEPLLIAVGYITRSKGPAVYVQLMPDRRSQKGALAQYDAWKSALPLMVGDLYFLTNVQDPKWTATLLAHLAQPKRLWRDVFKDFIQRSLQRELHRSDNFRTLWLQDLPESAFVTTTVAIEGAERLPGRQAKIDGILTAEFNLSPATAGERGGKSKSAKFEVKLGPDEFSIAKFELML